jgi:hypothetical protein
MLRYAAAFYTCFAGAILFCLTIYEAVRDHGLVLEARAVPKPMDPFSAVTFILWIACVVYTGWRGMEREAED